MTGWGRILVRLLVGFQVSQLLLFSTHSLWRNQQEFGLGAATLAPSPLTLLAENKALSLFAHIGGYATGYGFYAPRVGSHYLTEFRVHIASGPADLVLHDPALRTLEGRIRYRAFCDIFGGLLPQEARLRNPSDWEARICRATARALSERLALRKGATAVTCRIGVWSPAPLRGNGNKTGGQYVQLHETETR